MGNVFISSSGTGAKINDVFEEIRERDRELYGSDYYSGSFGSAHLARTRTISKLYSKESEKIALRYLKEEEENDSSYGNEIQGLDLGIVGYDIITVQKVKATGKPPKYVMQYCIYKDGYKDERPFKTYDISDRKIAEEKLLELGIHYPFATMTKEPILESGSSTITSIKVTSKRVTKEPKKIPAKATLLPIHKYLFYGWVKE